MAYFLHVHYVDGSTEHLEFESLVAAKDRAQRIAANWHKVSAVSIDNADGVELYSYSY